MRRRVDLVLGATGLLVLLLVVGLLLIRLGSHGGRQGVATTWDSYTTEGDGLRIAFGGSPCDKASKIAVDQQADRVVITVRLRASGQVCIDSAVRHYAEVRLDAPLGTRKVYDGACLDRPGGSEATCLRAPG